MQEEWNNAFSIPREDSFEDVFLHPAKLFKGEVEIQVFLGLKGTLKSTTSRSHLNELLGNTNRYKEEI